MASFAPPPEAAEAAAEGVGLDQLTFVKIDVAAAVASAATRRRVPSGISVATAPILMKVYLPPRLPPTDDGGVVSGSISHLMVPVAQTALAAEVLSTTLLQLSTGTSTGTGTSSPGAYPHADHSCYALYLHDYDGLPDDWAFPTDVPLSTLNVREAVLVKRPQRVASDAPPPPEQPSSATTSTSSPPSGTGAAASTIRVVLTRNPSNLVAGSSPRHPQSLTLPIDQRATTTSQSLIAAAARAFGSGGSGGVGGGIGSAVLHQEYELRVGEVDQMRLHWLSSR